jgi:hypothetical protein
MTKKNSLYVLKKNYLVRTVTMIYTGHLVEETEKELVFTNCSWIPETERWADTVEKGIFKEVEPYPEKSKVIINKGAVLDIVSVDWKLPTKQK